MKRFRLRLIQPTDLEAVFILMSDISYAKSALNSRHSIANVVKIPHDLRDRQEKIRGDDLRAKVEIDWTPHSQSRSWINVTLAIKYHSLAKFRLLLAMVWTTWLET